MAEHDNIFDWFRKHRSKHVPQRRELYECALNFWLDFVPKPEIANSVSDYSEVWSWKDIVISLPLLRQIVDRER